MLSDSRQTLIVKHFPIVPQSLLSPSSYLSLVLHKPANSFVIVISILFLLFLVLFVFCPSFVTTEIYYQNFPSPLNRYDREETITERLVWVFLICVPLFVPMLESLLTK